jgi:hypothetical protein
MAVSIVLEDGGEKFQVSGEAIFVTESFGSVYPDCLLTGW